MAIGWDDGFKVGFDGFAEGFTDGFEGLADGLILVVTTAFENGILKNILIVRKQTNKYISIVNSTF